MKKIILSLIIILSFYSLSFSQAAPVLNLQYSFTAAAASPVTNVVGRGIGYYIIKYVNTGPTAPSACTAVLQTSPDNVTWSTGISATCTSGGESAFTALTTSYIRVNVSTLTRVSDTTLTVNVVGYIESLGSVLSSSPALFADGTAAAPSIAFASTSASFAGFYLVNSNQIGWTIAGTSMGRFIKSGTSSQLWLASDTGELQFGAGQDARVVRDAANVIAIKNSTNDQELRVYASSGTPGYLRIFGAASDVFTVRSGVTLNLDATTLALRNAAGTGIWNITSAGLIPNADQAITIGNASTRVLFVYTTRIGAFGYYMVDGTTAVIHTQPPTSCVNNGCAIAATSSNSAGKLTTTTTGASSIVITFAITWTHAPSCHVENETTPNILKATSTTTTLTIAGTTVSGDSIAYLCVGY